MAFDENLDSFCSHWAFSSKNLDFPIFHFIIIAGIVVVTTLCASLSILFIYISWYIFLSAILLLALSLFLQLLIDSSVFLYLSKVFYIYFPFSSIECKLFTWLIRWFMISWLAFFGIFRINLYNVIFWAEIGLLSARILNITEQNLINIYYRWNFYCKYCLFHEWTNEQMIEEITWAEGASLFAWHRERDRERESSHMLVYILVNQHVQI